MSCYTCANCTPTEDMNICNDEVVFGQFPNGSVTLTFKNKSDGSVLTATGTASGGTLTIASGDLPSFIAGVGYSVTASEEWTLDSTVRECVSVRFVLKRGSDGTFTTSTSETVTVC